MEGYPDGFFEGQRTLTYYEFAQAVARLLDTICAKPADCDPVATALAKALMAAFAYQLANVSKDGVEPWLDWLKPYLTLEDQNFQTLEDSDSMTGAKTAPPAHTAYDDVPTTHWAYQALSALQLEGWLEGYPEGFFSGERTLTRYEVAQAVARVLDTMDNPGERQSDPIAFALGEALFAEFEDQWCFDTFGRETTQRDDSESQSQEAAREAAYEHVWKDVPASNWAYDAVRVLIDHSLLTDYPEGFFSGERLLARFDFAYAIVRASERISDSASSADPAVLALLKALEDEFADEIIAVNTKSYCN